MRRPCFKIPKKGTSNEQLQVISNTRTRKTKKLTSKVRAPTSMPKQEPLCAFSSIARLPRRALPSLHLAFALNTEDALHFDLEVLVCRAVRIVCVLFEHAELVGVAHEWLH